MGHPELLLFPILAATDMWLSLVSIRRLRRRYSQHIRSEALELNPRWQDSVHAGRVSSRFVAHVAALTGLLTVLGVLAARSPFADHIAAGVAGALLATYGAIIGRHLGNLSFCRYLDEHPDELSGEVYLRYPLSLAQSRAQLFAVLLPTLAIFAAWRSWFAFGAVVGVLGLMRVHSKWRRVPPRAPVDVIPAAEPATPSPG